MPHGIAINVGVNDPASDCLCVEEQIYGCEIDALNMAELARRAGFEVVPPLLGVEGTWANVEAELTWAANRLHSGDILLLSFSGHGCQPPDDDGCEEILCEAMCFADEMVSDHRLHEVWTKFDSEVRILVVADCCHSAGMLELRERVRRERRRREPSSCETHRFTRPADLGTALPRPAAAALPVGAAERMLRASVPVNASVLVLAASKEDETSRDGPRGGLFTTVLRHVWNGGNYSGTYASFIAEIQQLVSDENHLQHPTWAWVPPVFPTWFQTEKPFTI